MTRKNHPVNTITILQINSGRGTLCTFAGKSCEETHCPIFEIKIKSEDLVEKKKNSSIIRVDNKLSSLKQFLSFTNLCVQLILHLTSKNTWYMYIIKSYTVLTCCTVGVDNKIKHE